MPGNYSLIYTEAAGNSILASRRNAEHQNHINKMEPQYMADYSANTTEMRATEDPGEVGTESLPTSLQGELTRLRFALLETKQAIEPAINQWYETTSVKLVSTTPSGTLDLNPVTIVASSASTTYSATTVVDASAWDLSEVEVGMRVAVGSSFGIITVVNDGTDTVTVAEWVGAGTPSNGDVASIIKDYIIEVDGLSQLGQLRVDDGGSATYEGYGILLKEAAHGIGLNNSWVISGDDGDASLKLRVNEGSTPVEWKVFIDNSDSDILKLALDGTAKFAFEADTLTVGVGESKPIKITAENIAETSTPIDNTLYANMIPKAWAYTQPSGGGIIDGVNLTYSSSTTGTYVYLFKNAMDSANYAVMITAENANRYCYVSARSTAGFTIKTENSSTTLALTNHNVLVMGEQ